nr:MAG TPA: hypothetical protein [Caudoviricetes sp.]
MKLSRLYSPLMGTVKQFSRNHPQLDSDTNILKDNSKTQKR